VLENTARRLRLPIPTLPYVHSIERGNTNWLSSFGESVPLDKLPTLRYLIIVAQRLFILREKLAKNHPNLAILCNKVKNLQATTHLFDTLRLFDT